MRGGVPMIDLTYCMARRDVIRRIERRRRVVACLHFAAGLAAGFLAGVGVVLLWRG